ncbi:MAG: DUF3500 domain-containing protein, partial [Planctomycetota bacterium]
EDRAFDLIQSLSPEQLAEARRGADYVDLVFGPGARSIEPRPEGIRADGLTEKQRALLLALIEERVGILNDTHAKIAMEEIARELPATYFAWFGPTARGSAATYRIQGPSVLIEYAPQQLGGRATDHLHAMYRNPQNDYGAGFLRDPDPKKKRRKPASSGWGR